MADAEDMDSGSAPLESAQTEVFSTVSAVELYLQLNNATKNSVVEYLADYKLHKLATRPTLQAKVEQILAETSQDAFCGVFSRSLEYP